MVIVTQSIGLRNYDRKLPGDFSYNDFDKFYSFYLHNSGGLVRFTSSDLLEVNAPRFLISQTRIKADEEIL